MGRAPCCDKMGIKKGPWTPDEDQKLIAYIQQYGHGSWRALPKLAGLLRCGKSCRLRWTNYLRPDIKRGRFSSEEERMIIQLHAILGNRWSAIASHLAGRTDNEIKNYWNTHLKKRLLQMGIDPATHRPKSEVLDSHGRGSQLASCLSHMAQWESARLEAEARLAKCSKYGAPPEATTPSTEALLQPPWKHGAGDALRRTLTIANSSRPRGHHAPCKVDLSIFLHTWEQSLQGSSNLAAMAAAAATSSPAPSLKSTSCRALLQAAVKREECEPPSPTAAAGVAGLMASSEAASHALEEAAKSSDSEAGVSDGGLANAPRSATFSSLLKELELPAHDSSCSAASFSGGFPAELLMDFVEHSSTETASTSCINQAAITSWPADGAGDMNGDEWSNLFKFSGPLPSLQSPALAED